MMSVKSGHGLNCIKLTKSIKTYTSLNFSKFVNRFFPFLLSTMDNASTISLDDNSPYFTNNDLQAAVSLCSAPFRVPLPKIRFNSFLS